MTFDTVLCDLGNVLAPVDFARAGRGFAALAGRPFEEVFPRLRGQPYRELETGRLSPEGFFQALGETLGFSAPFERCRDLWNDVFTIDQETAALMAGLAERHRVYLWSNVSPIHLAYLRPRLPVLERFEGLHLSFELGALKPDRAFYAAAIARGNLVPERCVFVDDLAANLEGARAFNIQGVQHVTAEETRRALEALGLCG
jgi:putative hydrolase of the HAD superfamily